MVAVVLAIGIIAGAVTLVVLLTGGDGDEATGSSVDEGDQSADGDANAETLITETDVRAVVRDAPRTGSGEVADLAKGEELEAVCVLSGEEVSIEVTGVTTDTWVRVTAPVTGFVNDAILTSYPTDLADC